MSSSVCDICNSKPSLYNFTCCRWKCCSMDCYDVHKKTAVSTGDGQIKEGVADCGGPPHLTAFERRHLRLNKKQKTGGGLSIHEDIVLDTSTLTDEKKKKLENSAVLKKWFEGKTLRKDIQSICDAPSPSQRLADFTRNQDFANFLADLMTVLDIASNETSSKTAQVFN